MTQILLSAVAALIVQLASSIPGQAQPKTTQSCSTRPAFPAPDVDAAELRAVLSKPRATLDIDAGGITLPHHLLAADLIASGFAAIRREGIDKVVVLSPDHYKRSRRPFAVTTRPFETVFGEVCTAEAEAIALARSELVETSDLFEREHGVTALLPFIRYYLPGVPVLPVTVAIASRRQHWDAFIQALKPLLTERTLIVQSTDFSHYLAPSDAATRDQATLNVIAAGDTEGAGGLAQPQNLDSRGSQYIAMRLQEMRSGAGPIVLFNANSQAFLDEPAERTTSYVVQVFPRAPIDHALPDIPGSRVVCLAGDVFIGRFFARAMARPTAADSLLARAHDILRGCPTIVNLEGVFGTPGPPVGHDLRLVMAEREALSWLGRLGVIAAGLANNHSGDLGAAGLARTAAALESAGIVPLREGLVRAVGPLRIVALNDVANGRDGAAEIAAKAVAGPGHDAGAGPLVALLHWGHEWHARPGPEEGARADALAQAGFVVAAGAHPHVRSDGLTTAGRHRLLLGYSLGNFLFDQRDPASGAVLELRVFDQGTVFGRLIPIPNLFAEALATARGTSGSNPRRAGEP